MREQIQESEWILTCQMNFNQSFKFISRARCVKNEQIVQLTVIHIQGSHDHLKEHSTCKNKVNVSNCWF